MHVWWVMLLLNAVPLTEPQVQQLATARDGAVTWDEPALYPLLTNVVQWQGGGEAGAVVADYGALHRDPAGNRGQLFLIEGQLGGPPQPVRQRLARPGPWEQNLQQWSVLVQRDPDEVAVVLLADPMPMDQAPKRGGAPVRLAARFFKTWRFVDRQGQPTDYLIFVGKGVNVQTATKPVAPSPGPGGKWILLVVLVMGVAWMVLRRAVGGKTPRKRRHHASMEDQPDLPADPVDALAALDRDNDESND